MKILNAFLVVLLVVVIASCGSNLTTNPAPADTGTTTGSGGTNPSTRAPQGSSIYFGTQSPGDAWEIIMRPDNTFTATNMTTTSVFSGTYQVNSANGLITFSVSSPLTVTVYGSQIAGNALTVVPPGSNGNPIVAFAEGTSTSFDACTTVSSDHIGIGVPPANYQLTSSSPAYVQISTQTQGTGYSFAVNVYNLDGSFYDTQGNGVVFTCSNGVLSTTAKPVKAVIAESGAFAVDEDTDGGFVGVQKPASSIDLTALVTKQFLGTYVHTNTKTSVMAGASGASGVPNILVLGSFQNPATDTFANHGTEYSIDFSNATQATPGLIQGATVNGNPAVLVANTVGGKLMVLGLSTDSGPGDPILFSLMEK